MTDTKPRYPVDDLNERARYFHCIEWDTSNGYEYMHTRVNEADNLERPAGWELNVDRWPLADEDAAGWERVGPGVLRTPNGQLVAYWRRKR